MEPPQVEKFRTAGRGNGLRALASLRPGDLLFRSDPLAYTVCKGSRGVVCDRCLLGKEKLLRCSQCQVAKYCNAQCQKKAWQDHKRECKCLRSCKPRYPPDSVRLLGRVVIKLMEETPSDSEKLYSFYDLESNINKLTEDKKEGLRQLAVTFQHFMREEIQDASQLPPSFDIFEAFAKVICNSFTICNAELQDVGVGLYPSMSLLNHSCDPNCCIVFSGPHLFLRAVKAIEPGEELTICYLDVLTTRAERQQLLRDQYCFSCDCLRCQSQDKDAEMLAGDEQVWKEVQESLKKIEELKAQRKWEQTLALCRAVLGDSSARLPDSNVYQLKVLDCALDACINLGLWEEALLYGLRTLEPYRRHRNRTQVLPRGKRTLKHLSHVCSPSTSNLIPLLPSANLHASQGQAALAAEPSCLLPQDAAPSSQAVLPGKPPRARRPGHEGGQAAAAPGPPPPGHGEPEAGF